MEIDHAFMNTHKGAKQGQIYSNYYSSIYIKEYNPKGVKLF